MDKWSTDRPSTGGQFAQHGCRTKVSAVGALEWLARESRVPKHIISKIATRDRFGQPAPRTPRVELRVADALTTAMNCPEVFHDGTLEIKPNERASKEAREACVCSGSEGSVFVVEEREFVDDVWSSLVAALS